MNKTKYISILLSTLLLSNELSALDNSTTPTPAKDTSSVKYQVNENIAGVRLLTNEAVTKQNEAISQYNENFKNAPLKFEDKPNSIGTSQSSWSLVNSNCEPEFNMDSAFAGMMDKYKQALAKAMDPNLWKMWLMNEGINSAIEAYAYTMCKMEKFSDAEQKQVSAASEECMHTMNKDTIKTDSGTTTGTTNGANTETVVDAASMAFSAMCMNEKMDQIKGAKWPICIAEKKGQAQAFLNGTIKNALDFGMADLGIQNQKCMLDKQNAEDDIQNFFGDGYQGLDEKDCPIGTYCSPYINQIHADGSVTQVSNPNYGKETGMKSGNNKSGASKNKIITTSSFNKPENSIAARSSTLNNSNENNVALGGMKNKDIDSLNPKALLSARMVLANWSYAIFNDDATSTRYTSGSYDMDLIDGRWDFPYVVGKEPPSSFGGLSKAQTKVPIITECEELVNDNALTVPNPIIVTMENGKNPSQYKKVTFQTDKKEQPNRYYYFLRTNKNVVGNATFNPEDHVEMVPEYVEDTLFFMRASCIDWASSARTSILNEAGGIFSSLSSDGTVKTVKTAALTGDLDRQVVAERQSRLDSLNSIINSLGVKNATYSLSRKGKNNSKNYNVISR